MVYIKAIAKKKSTFKKTNGNKRKTGIKRCIGGISGCVQKSIAIKYNINHSLKIYKYKNLLENDVGSDISQETKWRERNRKNHVYV